MPATQISLDNFDFAFNGEVNEAQVRTLATADFVSRGENVRLIGGPATGKTHIAWVIEQAARQRGLTTVELRLSSAFDMNDELIGREFGTGNDFRADLLKCDLLIVDEVEKRIASLMFLTLLRLRARLGKSTLLTSYSHTWDQEMNRELVTNQTNGRLPSLIATRHGDNEWVALLNPHGFEPSAFGQSDQRPHLLEVQAMLAATGMFWQTVTTGDRSYRKFLRSKGQLA